MKMESAKSECLLVLRTVRDGDDAAAVELALDHVMHCHRCQGAIQFLRSASPSESRGVHARPRYVAVGVVALAAAAGLLAIWAQAPHDTSADEILRSSLEAARVLEPTIAEVDAQARGRSESLGRAPDGRVGPKVASILGRATGDVVVYTPVLEAFAVTDSRSARDIVAAMKARSSHAESLTLVYPSREAFEEIMTTREYTECVFLTAVRLAEGDRSADPDCDRDVDHERAQILVDSHRDWLSEGYAVFRNRMLEQHDEVIDGLRQSWGDRLHEFPVDVPTAVSLPYVWAVPGVGAVLGTKDVSDLSSWTEYVSVDDPTANRLLAEAVVNSASRWSHLN